VRCIGAACLAWLAFAAPALAAGYDDFTLGMTANLRGESERAVTAFTAALAAPDLAAPYKPAAYRGRASAYLQLDKCPEAMADIKAFEALRQSDRPLLRLRVWVELCLTDAVAARKDFELLNKNKLDAGDLWSFAMWQWRYGLYDEAAANARDGFKQSDKTVQFSLFVLLWQAVNEIRAGKFDANALSASLAEVKYAGWPRPIFDLYLGKLTPEALLGKASSSFWDTAKQAQRCEVNFFAAEWHLGRHDTGAATAMLLDGVKTCPADLVALSSAKTELKRLGVAVPKE